MDPADFSSLGHTASHGHGGNDDDDTLVPSQLMDPPPPLAAAQSLHGSVNGDIDGLEDHDSIHGDSMSMDEDGESFSRSALWVGIAPVVDGALYIGPLKAVAGPLTCQTLGIGAYLCVAKEVAMPAHVVESGAPSLHLPLRDAADECLATHLPAALAFIDAQTSAGRRVVVFCQQGKSRSAAVAAAYVQRRVEGVADSAAAVSYLSRRYPRAELSMNFLQQLHEAPAASRPFEEPDA